MDLNGVLSQLESANEEDTERLLHRYNQEVSQEMLFNQNKQAT